MRRSLVLVGALACALATMAPTCSKGDNKSHTEETDDSGADKTTTSPGLKAEATVTAAATVPAAPPEEGSATVEAAAPAGGDPLFKDPAAVIDSFEDGSTAIVVDKAGKVRMALADPDGKPLTDRKVKLFYDDEPGKPVDVALAYDPEQHLYVGELPVFEESITPVSYEIIGGPKPWKGIVHLPEGGTKVIVDSGSTAAAIHATPLEGPHGGRIERVGDDDVELLLDPDSGETRAWIIVDGRVAPPRERVLALYIDNHYVETYPDDNDSFYAKVSFGAGFSFSAVSRVSVALTVGERVHTCLFGWRPHVRVYAYRPFVDVRVVGWSRERKHRWDKHPNSPVRGWAKRKEKLSHHRHLEHRGGHHDGHDHDSHRAGGHHEEHRGGGDHHPSGGGGDHGSNHHGGDHGGNHHGGGDHGGTHRGGGDHGGHSGGHSAGGHKSGGGKGRKH